MKKLFAVLATIGVGLIFVGCTTYPGYDYNSGNGYNSGYGGGYGSGGY